jgi:hypothetical protein
VGVGPGTPCIQEGGLRVTPIDQHSVCLFILIGIMWATLNAPAGVGLDAVEIDFIFRSSTPNSTRPELPIGQKLSRFQFKQRTDKR